METGLDRNADGTFKVGNKEGGRTPGGDKISRIVKQSIVDFMEHNTPKIQESFDQVKPAEKLRFISELMPYVMPKVGPNENGQPITLWSITLNVSPDRLHTPLDTDIPKADN